MVIAPVTSAASTRSTKRSLKSRPRSAAGSMTAATVKVERAASLRPFA